MAGGTDLRSRGLWLLKPCTRRLIGFLGNQDPHVRGEAARALGQIADPEAVSPLVEALMKEKQDEQMPLALAEIGDPAALAPLIEAFNQADREVRPNICAALGAFKDQKAVACLITGLSDPDPNVRFHSIASLGRQRDPAAVSHLLGCLGEANEWIFLSVVEALSRIGDHRATNPLVAFYLKEGNERKRAAIITALGFLKDLTSVPTLTKALRDPDDRVKANAIEALRRLDLPKDKILNLIQPFLKHANNRVRGNTIVTVAALKLLDLRPIIEPMRQDPDKWVRATLGYVLTTIDHPQALPMIVELLKDEDGDVKKNAARALAARATDRQTDVLIHLLDDPTPFVRLQAVQTLGKIKAVAAVAGLGRIFATERNFKIRSAIVTALGAIGDQAAVPLLQTSLRDRDSRVRANAVESLEGLLGEAAGSMLRPMLADPDNRTRSNAAKALFRIGDVAVLGDLENMLQDKEPATRISAAYALGQIGLALKELEVSPLLQPLKSSLTTVKVQPPAAPAAVNLAALAKPATPAVPDVRKPVGKEAMREAFLAHYNAGRFKEALDGVTAYVAQFPFDLMANFFLGNLNFQLSRFDAAIDAFKKVVEMDPFHVQAYSNMGIACFRTGRLQEAIHYFRQALKIQPDLSSIRFNLANLLLKEHKWEEAIQQYEEGRRYQKAPARVLANLGFAYQKTGQYEKAVASYEASTQADPRDPGVYYNWALILIRQGKKDLAREVVKGGLHAVPPGSAGVKTLRELLERLQAPTTS